MQYQLHNGISIPALGLGTWQTPNDETVIQCVKEAVACGYRHIDGAACYHNEQGVGAGIREAIREGLIRREDLFVTSKVWNPERGYEKTKAAFEKTCADLGLETLDLYLIHWPASHHQFENWEEINLDTWRAMTELYKEGRIRSIGVSNFLPHHLEALVNTEVAPMVNQIEFHPGMLQEETVAYCKEHDIVVEAWSPLGMGRMLQNETLTGIAAGYQKSVAQLCIRWVLQHGVLPLPKSKTIERIKENIEVFDFEISPEDMAKIDALPNFGGSGMHPDEVEF